MPQLRDSFRGVQHESAGAEVPTIDDIPVKVKGQTEIIPAIAGKPLVEHG